MLGAEPGHLLGAESRRESRKRRRLSERRRIFGRLGFTGGDDPLLLVGPARGRNNQQASTTDRSGTSSYQFKQFSSTQGICKQSSQRSGSPMQLSEAQGAKISMKIQFHITIAPDNEPLILDPGASGLASAASQLFANQMDLEQLNGITNAERDDSDGGHMGTRRASQAATKCPAGAQESAFSQQRASISSIGEQIHEKLSRQSTLSSRRRQQLLAMHNQSALDNNTTPDHLRRPSAGSSAPTSGRLRSDSASRGGSATTTPSREAGARSSTISGGMQDEATMQFLARHQARSSSNSSRSIAGPHFTATQHCSPPTRLQREHIYFKRDGQRFGHEFTLKLAVDRSYRCLLKVRPLIPLQAISIQGHHVAFVDCSTNPGAHLSSSAPASTGSLNGSLQSMSKAPSLQRFHEATGGSSTSTTTRLGQARTSSAAPMYGNEQHSVSLSSANSTTSSSCGGANGSHANTTRYQRKQHQQHQHQHQRLAIISLAEQRRLSSAASNPPSPTRFSGDQLAEQSALGSGGPAAAAQATTGIASKQLQAFLVKQQQHQQMMRHFASSHCSPSGSHLGGQSIYMFDWSAGRFEVNKNKARTQVQTVLKFKNGQLLSLPLQVKFYQPESRQHLNWGSQLHFIDYDCNIDSLGQIELEKVHYY